MRYDTILYDLDNTLLDFNFSQKRAFFRAFPGRDEAFYQTFEAINRAQWKRLERGEAQRAEILHERFARFFEKVGVAEDPDAANARYVRELGKGCDIVAGIPETLDALAALGCTLAVVTNGLADVQNPRLRESGLLPYFRCVLVSEEIGYVKPDPRIFQKAAALCGAAAPARVLVVGDSPTSDIAGGAAAGFDTCWYRHEELPLPEGCTPIYVVTSPKDVISIVKGEAQPQSGSFFSAPQQTP